jgi:hypothetical protein
MTANEKSVPSMALMMRHTMSIAATARLKKAIPDHTILGVKPTFIMTKVQENGSGTKTIENTERVKQIHKVGRRFYC